MSKTNSTCLKTIDDSQLCFIDLRDQDNPFIHTAGIVRVPPMQVDSYRFQYPAIYIHNDVTCKILQDIVKASYILQNDRIYKTHKEYCESACVR